jgi:hypothetical protein
MQETAEMEPLLGMQPSPVASLSSRLCLPHFSGFYRPFTWVMTALAGVEVALCGVVTVCAIYMAVIAHT